jgi:hypothetical protein
VKKLVVFVPLGLALVFTVGCSKLQTTAVLAEKWDTGQHRTCLYGHSRLFCVKPEEVTAFKPPTTPYKMESLREGMAKDPRTDAGSYEAKFTSHTPMDFSIWDCYKTGTGSPAIACNLTHKPTKEESASFVTSEKEQEQRSRLEQVASNYLMQLNPADLLDACGRGEESGGQKLPYSGKNDLREDTRIKYPFAELKFSYLGMHGTPSKASYIIQTVKIVSTATPSDFWDIELQAKYHEAALEVVQNIPCLFSQVQLRNNRHLPDDRAANADGVPIPEL